VITLSGFLCFDNSIMASSKPSNDKEDSDWTDDEVIPTINPSNKIKMFFQKLFFQIFAQTETNKWIGDPRGSLFELFNAFLT
jgi:hypothetical protein